MSEDPLDTEHLDFISPVIISFLPMIRHVTISPTILLSSRSKSCTGMLPYGRFIKHRTHPNTNLQQKETIRQDKETRWLNQEIVL